MHARQIGHVHPPLHRLGRAVAHVDRLAPAGGSGHEGQRIDVGRALDHALEAAELLGAHVAVLAGELPAEQRAATEVGRLGDAEVDDLRVADEPVLDDHVVGAEVAVDDAEIMGLLQARGHPAHHRLHVLERHLALGGVVVGQRGALDELHHQAGALDARIDREQHVAHDRVVVQPAQHRGLFLEEVQDLLVMGQGGEHDLDRHRLLGVDVEPAIDLAHAAGGDVLGDLEGAHDLRADGHAGGGRRADDGLLTAGLRVVLLVAGHSAQIPSSGRSKIAVIGVTSVLSNARTTITVVLSLAPRCKVRSRSMSQAFCG